LNAVALKKHGEPDARKCYVGDSTALGAFLFLAGRFRRNPWPGLDYAALWFIVKLKGMDRSSRFISLSAEK
jgi:hypothetical protein